VVANAVAVAAPDGHAELLVTDSLGGGMSTLSPEFAARLSLQVRERVPVPTRSLGGILDEISPRRVRLLKLDCEGGELELLRSLTGDQRGQLDSVALEFHLAAYPLEDLVEMVLEWGEFHCSKVATGDVANANLHLVSRSALRTWGRGSAFGAKG
jgi:hypothetical protein